MVNLQPIWRSGVQNLALSHILGAHLCSVSPVFVSLQGGKQLNFNVKQQIPELSFTTSNYCSGKGLKKYIKH